MTVLAIAAVELRRVLRDRTAAFFMVLLPAVIILVIGASMTHATTLRIGLVAPDRTGLAGDLVAELSAQAGIEIRPIADEEAATTALRRGEVAAVAIIPADLDTALRSDTTTAIPVLGIGPESTRTAALSALEGAVSRLSARVLAARITTHHTGTFDDNLSAATRVQTRPPPVTVRLDSIDATPTTGFSQSAPSMLVLFVFINSLAGGAALIQARRWGIHSRVLAAPVRTTHLVLGETLACTAIALAQSLLIIGIGSLLFSVIWGDPTAATALVLLWTLFSAATGVLAGALFRTPDQATAIGPAVGIALGMLGGAMWPLDIVPAPLRTLGHLTPHAWALDAWRAVTGAGAGPSAIGRELAILAAFTTVALVAAIFALRRRVLR
jgi:ABC-2 type transport system permease protein